MYEFPRSILLMKLNRIKYLRKYDVAKKVYFQRMGAENLVTQCKNKRICKSTYTDYISKNKSLHLLKIPNLINVWQGLRNPFLKRAIWF